MIYEFSRDIASALTARKYPAPVLYGPDFLERRHVLASVVVFERDHELSDSVKPATGAQRGLSRPGSTVSSHKLNRGLATRVVFYMQCTEAGARPNEHENLCERYVDAVLVAIHEWCVAGKSAYEIAEARYLKPEEIDRDHAPSGFSGVAYVLRFHLARGVYVLDYEGKARNTGVIAHVSNTAEVRQAGADPEAPPEIVEL